ncbi:MAG: ABC transporter permease [Acidobacteriales bacterium]|nr:ABC transporter permease [Terriglobales bacterium]MCI0422449.1 ABC transporter permease [Acidobacteriota bacterium]MCI0622015.1 ABC transporter permease [Acidobacteriota bacterium]MCI0718940.1 ABC transporter permease [Acidobacteriota bacterium]
MIKEFRQALREPRMRIVLFVPPVLQLILFGFAVNLDVSNASIAWMDLDRTAASADLRASFDASPTFTVNRVVSGETEVRELLDHGEVMAVVRVLAGFGKEVKRGRTSAVQVLVEGTNSNTASLVANYAGQIVGRFANQALQEQQRQRQVAFSIASGGPVNLSLPSLDVRQRVWFNPDLRSRNFFVPGVLVNIVALVTVMLTAMSIVREKEIGTMEQLMVTPIRPLELMLGKTLPFALIGMLQVTIMTVLALAVFRVPFRGNFLVLLACAALFLLTTLGSGLFISTISHTQQQAMMTFFFIFMPMFLLSGFAFPINSMPGLVQFVTYLNPLRYFMEIIRGIFLRGTGPSIFWPQILVLAVFGITILSASALRFRKKLD